MEVSVGSVDIEEVSSNGKEVFRSLRSALELKSSVLAFALTFLKKNALLFILLVCLGITG